ncbi:MAG: C/D box methylation guide ribonucleoprotein complex aNOP56 subunit [Candidatus Micrarchaeota archaeon]
MDLRQELMQKAKSRLREITSEEDASLIHAVRCLDDLDSAKSLLYQRLAEWHKPFFPELRLKNEETLCKFIIEFGASKKLSAKTLAEIVGEDKAAAIVKAASSSRGIDAGKEDEAAMKSLAARVLELYTARSEIQAFVEEKSRKKMPNICTLVEPLLAARLLSLAGSLKNLAEMPASTIQVIGAEKSLFKHLRSGTQPPKHGVIFQAPEINAAPLHQRGRISRALATKLAIAVKADYYTHHFIADKLKANFDKRVKQIQDAPIREKQAPRQYTPRPPRRFGSRPPARFGSRPPGRFDSRPQDRFDSRPSNRSDSANRFESKPSNRSDSSNRFDSRPAGKFTTGTGYNPRGKNSRPFNRGRGKPVKGGRPRRY